MSKHFRQKTIAFEMVPTCVTIHSLRAHFHARSIATKRNISIENVPLFTVIRVDLPFQIAPQSDFPD